MRAIVLQQFGDASQLIIGTYPKPTLLPLHIKVRVFAFGLNRADILQREGKYPPPKGASELLGLEIAGEVVETGAGVEKWSVGDKVFGLLSGGGYAEFAVIHQDMALSIPKNMTFEQAAAIPEAFLTAFQALHILAKINPEETVLIHAGGSGVGTAAIQIAKDKGATVVITASKAKHEKCKLLGAELCITYQTENFKDKILELTQGKGVDCIIDFMGASYFEQNLQSLNFEGRLVMLAFLGGVKIQHLNLLPIIQKRLQILGSTLRSRNLEYQIRLTQAFWQYAEQKFIEGTLVPVIDSVFSWQEIRQAHQFMEANQNFGKIVLKID